MTKNGDIFLLMTRKFILFSQRGIASCYVYMMVDNSDKNWPKFFLFLFSIVYTPAEETYFFQLWTRYYTKTLRQLLSLLTKCQKYATFFCHVQVTFRQLLTMLAIFDLSFIICAFISFSLPQLSPHWKVSRIRIALMKIFGQFWGDYETINLGRFDIIFVTISFCCHSPN